MMLRPERWTIAAAALLSIAVSSLPAAAQTVPGGHPRIYLRAADVSALRTRITQPPVSTYYSQMRSRMDAAAARHANNEVAGFELESLAVLHLINGGTTYRDKILNTWRVTSYSPGQIDHWALPYQVMGHALALDYLWNDITAAQRQALGSVIVAMTDDLYAYAPHDIGFANQMSDYSNQLYFHLGALAFAGIVLANEGIDDGRASFYLTQANTLLLQHMIPAINQEAGGDADLARQSGFIGRGGWGEDAGHLEMTHPMLGRMVEAWRTGTGVDLFPRLNGLATLPRYLLYLRRPNGYMAPKGNSSYTMLMPDKSLGALGCLSTARYGDPLGRAIKNITYAGTTYGFHQAGPVLWCNPAVAAPNLADLPKTQHFQGQGEVVVRSGFGAADSWMYFRSGPIYNGHQHDDQGNLLLEAYGGELLVEHAGSEVNHETIHHNSIRVGGVDQTPYFNNAVQHAQPIAGTSYERGRITNVVETSQYTYVASDFGMAYPDSVVPAPKAGKVTRELVMILPDVLVIRDRVVAAGTHEVLFHTWSGAGSFNASQRELVATRGGGRAHLRTLLPATATAQVSQQGTTDLLTVRASGSGQVDFLHVVVLSPASAGFTPAITDISTTQTLGASVRDRQGRSWAVRFQRGGVGLAAVTLDGAPPPGTAPAPPTGVRIVLP